MLKINFKKNSFIILISLSLGGVFYTFLPPVQALQISNYPSFLNIKEGMGFVELISTIFNFLLLVAGLAAFVVIILGGIRYLTSVGDPSKMDDAKSQIFSAILGIIVLFSSWMVLNTINPNLVELKEPEFTASPTQPGFSSIRIPGTCAEGKNYIIEIYSDVNYSGDRKCFEVGEEEESYSKSVRSIKNNGTTIKLFDETNFAGKNICFLGSVPDTDKCILAGANDCIPKDNTGWNKPKSFKISANCSNPGTTLTADGNQVWESCDFWSEGYVPTCIYK